MRLGRWGCILYDDKWPGSLYLRFWAWLDVAVLLGRSLALVVSWVAFIDFFLNYNLITLEGCTVYSTTCWWCWTSEWLGEVYCILYSSTNCRLVVRSTYVGGFSSTDHQMVVRSSFTSIFYLLFLAFGLVPIMLRGGDRLGRSGGLGSIGLAGGDILAASSFSLLDCKLLLCYLGIVYYQVQQSMWTVVPRVPWREWPGFRSVRILFAFFALAPPHDPWGMNFRRLLIRTDNFRWFSLHSCLICQ